MIILHTLINEERHQAILDRYLESFSENFKSDIHKYRRWQDAQLSLLGRVLLEYGVKKYFNISEAEICALSNKKPYLKGNPVYFNISHSREMVACAIAEFPIGIDIEFMDTAINYLDFQFQMTPAEFAEIHQSEDKIKSFFSYWTRKEAVIKAHGDGMMIPLDSFEVLDNECTIEGKRFFTKEIFIDKNYKSCMASEDKNIKNEVPIFVPLQF
nr:4'-phosphopantetheinyl transferase superfamily protein [uncultured Chryseobacterium sp.]